MKQIVFLLACLLMATSQSYADIDKKFYGSYIGLSLSDVHAGASFEDSLTHLLINATGLHQGIGGFDVSYSPDWLTDVHNSEVLSRWFTKGLLIKYDYLALLQEKNGDLAQSIFQFVPKRSLTRALIRAEGFFSDNPFKLEVYEFLGEGIPAPLAFYTKFDGNGKWKAQLQFLYDRTKAKIEATPKQEDHSWLKPIDFNKDMATLKSATASLSEKRDVIDRAENNLWTGKENEINERLALFKYAIEQSGDRALISHGLYRTHLGARVGGIAPIVIAGLRASLSRIRSGETRLADEIDILKNGIEAATIHLYEAFAQHRHVAEAYSRFGSVDIREIKSNTQGRMKPEDAELLSKLLEIQSRPKTRHYERADLDALRKLLKHAIEMIKDEPRLSGAVQNANRGLNDYPNPYECKNVLRSL
jgi:hypothetical protein